MDKKLQEEIERLEREVAELQVLTEKEKSGTLSDEQQIRLAQIRAKAQREHSEAKAKLTAGLVAVVLVAGALIWWMSGSDDRASERAAREAAREPERRLSSARFACQEFVRQQLRSPSTAEFPWGLQQAANEGGGDYFVTGSVDAQNAFGAMLRQPYTCRVSRTGGNWVLRTVEIGD